MNQPVNLFLVVAVPAAAMLAVWLRARHWRQHNTGGRRSVDATSPVPDGSASGASPHPALPASNATLEVSDTQSLPRLVGAGDGAVATSLVASATGDRPRTMTDLLEGIRLPYDLMPITSAVEDADRHVVFLTTHSNAGEVGKRFADELERLGFELESVEFDQAVAVRGSDVVSIKIVPEADQVEVAGGRRYGAAGRGDVALEAWIGRSPVPPSASD